MKKLEGLESLNQSIKQAPEKLKTTYAEIANKGNSVKMTLTESKNEEVKGYNIIMYNCPETNIKNKDERKEKELETINYF